MKSLIMKDAWKRAKRAVVFKGGNAKEWMSWALTKAWAAYKRGELTEQVQEQQPKMKGRMTEKQERFITSLLRKKATDNPVAKAFNVSSLRGTISKQQASDLISELLAA